MKKSYLLGIDIGTSACKVAVFDREGRVLAASNVQFEEPTDNMFAFNSPLGACPTCDLRNV